MEARETLSKRSNEETHSSDRQQRQKREKYTPTACNGCKKRKIKCSGGATCQRCERHGLQCVYAQSASATNDASTSNPNVFEKLGNLEKRFGKVQSQVDQIYNMFSNIQARAPDLLGSFASVPIDLSTQELPAMNDAAVSGPNSKAKRHQKSQFEGPTSSAYSFNVGKSSLKNMGVQSDREHLSTEPESGLNSPRHSPRLQPQLLPVVLDPLKQLGLDEALRLVNVYKEELDGIYPFLDVPKMERFIHTLYADFHSTSTSDQCLHERAAKIDPRDTDIVKIVFAQVLTIEGLGSSVLAERMVESVDRGIIGRVRTMQADLRDVKINILQSIYYFHCDEEVVAWRTIGFAVRLALEMGLHRKETLFKRFPDPEERSWATKIFWCVYVLDRRWSFGTGMPFALHQQDIDPGLPEPDESSPYLQKMVSYGRINTRVWKAVNGSAISNKKSPRKDESEYLDSDYLDFQIQQWQQSIPRELQLIHPKTNSGNQIQPSSLHRLRVLLYLRANQMRILIFRHHLLNTASINKNRLAAQNVVDIAKDTIQVLAHLHRTSNIYHTQQVCFNYFLVLALATLFLAVCHSPTLFSSSCRTEFYLALELVKGFSSKSLISQRLWKTIRDLRHIGPKIGLTPTAAAEDNMAMPTPSSVDMVEHNNRHAPDQSWNFTPVTMQQDHGNGMIPYEASDIGNHMSYALTDLFEAAGGNMGDERMMGGMHRGQVSGMGIQYPLEDNEDVSRLLGNLISWDNSQFI